MEMLWLRSSFWSYRTKAVDPKHHVPAFISYSPGSLGDGNKKWLCCGGFLVGDCSAYIQLNSGKRTGGAITIEFE